MAFNFVCGGRPLPKEKFADSSEYTEVVLQALLRAMSIVDSRLADKADGIRLVPA